MACQTGLSPISTGHAESAEVLEEDEESVKLRANVLPPVQRRVGLVLLVAGPDALSPIPPTYATPAATSRANCSRTTRPRASSLPLPAFAEIVREGRDRPAS